MEGQETSIANKDSYYIWNRPSMHVSNLFLCIINHVAMNKLRTDIGGYCTAGTQL